jgi:H+-transporting ATPase
MPDVASSPLRMAFAKFWAPVPWMLEAATVLELTLGKYLEAAIIAALLAFNAALGFFQESRAQATLAALKSKLAFNASVRREGAWVILPAADLVQGDLIKLSLGAVVPADVHLTGGNVLLDQSMLTGESLPVEAAAGVDTYAGTLVKRGEATAQVTAIGAHTKFGRTAELIREAHVTSSQQKAVFRVVRNLAACNGFVIVLMVGYAHFLDMPVADIIPLALTGILASIPVALPATFTLAAAIGARALAALGVLPTRLSAVDEAASMDVLCADKTGTLTRNELAVTSVYAVSGLSEPWVLTLAALASSEAGEDPVDAAIRTETARRKVPDAPGRTGFVPFDPANKRSEASFVDSTGVAQRVMKGAVSAIVGFAPIPAAASAAEKDFEARGFRVLAVASGPANAMKFVGLVALSDPAREDSPGLVTALHGLGIRVVMVTGDGAATATTVAHSVGLSGAVCPAGPIPSGSTLDQFSVFAGVLPDGKYQLVKALQASQHTVGMCGDGANDAPALRQAQIGIAVSTATDVAKSAAGMVLTTPGLAGIVAAVNEGRLTFQRILTYTLNSITKKIVQVLFLATALVMTGQAILTPMLMVIIMITGDFLGMSLTTDHVRPSASPNSWKIRELTFAGILMGLGELLFCTCILAFGKYSLRLDLDHLRSLAFLVIVFGNQATTYDNRERRRLWVVISSMADVLIASTLSLAGILMTPLPIPLVLGTLAAAAAFAVIFDFAKVPAFRRLGIT